MVNLQGYVCNVIVSSKLYFNVCNLKSSSIKNVDTPATDKSAISPLTSYFWTDHLIQTQSEEILMKVVEFVREATVLDRSDEHMGEGSRGICNPQTPVGRLDT